MRPSHPPPVLESTRVGQDLLRQVAAQASALRDEGERTELCRRLQLPEAQWPWQDLLVPFVVVFERELRQLAPSFETLLGEAAKVELRRSLVADLADLCAPSLGVRFAVQKAMSPLRSDPAATTQYRRFVRACLSDGYGSWLADYPGLGPACAALLRGRSTAVAEVLERYETDSSLLVEHFTQGRAPGPILALRTGLSDPHRGGRTVFGLTLAEGSTLYYHPKDLGLFAAFNDLLDWINARGNPVTLRLTRSLARPGYGWMEDVARRPCSEARAVGRFYDRAGQLLCLAYVLNATDLHCENLIPCGEHPVLIDLETLFQPELEAALFASGDQELDPSLVLADDLCTRNSVLRTMMLPNLTVTPQGAPADYSALGAPWAARIKVHTSAWEHLNTDGMTKTFRAVPRPPQANAVYLGAQLVAAQDHLPELLAGFSRMHRFLRANARALLAPDGPMAAMRGRTGRFLFRSTGLYHHLLRESVQPRALQDPAGEAPYRRSLARVFLPAGQAHPLGALAEAEGRALARRDYPYFTFVTDARDLAGEGLEPLRGVFPASGFDLAAGRLQALDEEDLERQSAYIRGIFALNEEPGPGTEPAERAAWAGHPPGEPEAFLKAALAVAASLRKTAVTAGPGSATWLGARYHTASGLSNLEPLGLGLYDGQAGVAHFLAALEFVTGGAGYRDLALAALRPLRLEVGAGRRSRRLRELGLGGATGWGSLVYSLTRCAGWLDLPELLDEAARAAELIRPDAIAQDRALDVMNGSAGACLGLLALHRAVPGGPWLAAAVDCGDHLLALQQPGPGASRAWPGSEPGALQGGFAHGAAGIAHALARLAWATGAGRFKAAAERAFDFEQELFDPIPATWGDQWRPDGGALGENQHRWCSWCHGPGGIGLALASGRLHGREAQVEAAVAAILRQGLAPANHLCCGNFGLAETLCTAGLRLGRPEWREAGLRLAAAALARAPEPPFGLSEFHTPAFFKGATGCAYQGLRLAYGDRLPSALLWE